MRPLPGVDWELEELLGVGGFGEVWKARHAHLTSKPPVALKFCLDPSAARVLRNEAGVLDRLMQHGRQHGIVPLLQAYLDADPPCLEYEYVEGGDLTGLIQELHAQGRADAGRGQPADPAPGGDHRRRASGEPGHRPRRPEAGERPGAGGPRTGPELHVTDFGIGGLAVARAVRQTRQPTNSREQLLTEAVRGAYTPLYASPQQMTRRRGEPPDPRDDVHALGVIWYQLVTGDLTMLRVPAGLDGGAARARPERGVDPVAGDRCLAKAEKRPASAGILAAELRALTAPPPVPPRAPPPPPPPPPVRESGARRVQEAPRRRDQQVTQSPGHWRLWASLAAVVLILGVLGAVWLSGLFHGSGSPPAKAHVSPDGKSFTNTFGMEFRWIEPGTFQMGSSDSDKDALDDERPQHEVEITKGYYLGTYPVTRGQFAAFVKDAGYQTDGGGGENPFTEYNQTDNDPVVWVSWNDAQAFCVWLSKKEGKSYELPTEAEWEYACRAGSKSAYFFGDDARDLGDYAWFEGNAEGHTHPVGGGKKANPWGLYDMGGNVWQWCADYYDKDYYAKRNKKDPKNDKDSDRRILRGGSWINFARTCRSANRFYVYNPANPDHVNGFRVVLRSPPRTP